MRSFRKHNCWRLAGLLALLPLPLLAGSLNIAFSQLLIDDSC